GRHWGRLHRLAYAIAVLAVLHFWWIVKSDYREPLLYAAILALLLGWRMARRLARPRASARPEQQQRGQGRGDADRGQQPPGEPWARARRLGAAIVVDRGAGVGPGRFGNARPALRRFHHEAVVAVEYDLVARRQQRVAHRFTVDHAALGRSQVAQHHLVAGQ